MPCVWSREGEILALRSLTDRPLMLRLYVNDVEPERGDSFGDYREADFPGYAPCPLAPDGWSILEDDEPVRSQYPKQWFRAAADLEEFQEVYGGYITAGATLVLAEKFAGGPRPIGLLGDKVSVTPTITQQGK